MSEPYQRETDSPLVSERGTTKISDGVVARIAGISAQEVDGVHMGGSASRTAGGLLGGVTGSESQTRGVSVEVGKMETAIDLKMGIEYGRNILERAELVRDRISERVENITGLRVTELNVTVSDVVFPEEGGEGRSGQSRGPLYEDQTRQMGTGESEVGDRDLGGEDTERVDLGAARAEAITRSGSRFSEETIRTEDKEEDETTELRLEDEETGRRGRRREEDE